MVHVPINPDMRRWLISFSTSSVISKGNIVSFMYCKAMLLSSLFISNSGTTMNFTWCCSKSTQKSLWQPLNIYVSHLKCNGHNIIFCYNIACSVLQHYPIFEIVNCSKFWDLGHRKFLVPLTCTGQMYYNWWEILFK